MKNILSTPDNENITEQLTYAFLKDKGNVIPVSSNGGGSPLQVKAKLSFILCDSGSEFCISTGELSTSMKLQTISNIQNELNLVSGRHSECAKK